MLASLQRRTTLATAVADFWPACMAALDENAFDIPFALLYSARPEYHARGKDHGDPERYRLVLVGALGVPQDHPSATREVVVSVQDEDFAYSRTSSLSSDKTTMSSTSLAAAVSSPEVWPFAEVLDAGGEVVLIEELGTRAEGFSRRGWGPACTHAVSFSLGVQDQPPGAVIVLGLNPCRYACSMCKAETHAALQAVRRRFARVRAHAGRPAQYRAHRGDGACRVSRRGGADHARRQVRRRCSALRNS